MKKRINSSIGGAFGSLLESRNYNSEKYRVGFNNQEKDDEVSGVGNSYTAEFWQYSPRLGRRFNVDPVVKAWESPLTVISLKRGKSEGD